MPGMHVKHTRVVQHATNLVHASPRYDSCYMICVEVWMREATATLSSTPRAIGDRILAD